ncbi:hypothetical protein GTP45_13680 [Pseudoduganella sp. FT55W]|uniref:Uncharacterized protein n=1 Tax=Duganella rivi TaxID=2666083 RepID=A0A7X4GQW4_9BURK|nr:hypothetical protein [Duganella rivi]MYM67878.1 hypothetical protein [Duganella rivi]
MRNVIGVLAGVMLAGGLSGCSSLRIHSEARDKQGQAAQEAYKKVDLSAIFSTASDNLNKQLVTELDSQDRLGAAIRATDLAAIVQSSNLHNSVVAKIDQRLLEVGGATATSPEAMQKYLDKLSTFKEIKEAQEDVTRYFKRAGLPAPQCNQPVPDAIQQALQNASGNLRFGIQGQLDKAARTCAKAAELGTVWNSFDGSEIAKAVATANADQKDYDALAAASKVLTVAYNKARKEYDEAAAQGDSEENKKKVQEKAKQLGDAIDKLDQAKDAISTEFISQERIDAVQKFVDVVLRGLEEGKAPSDATSAQAAFILIPQQVDSFKSAMAAAQTPMLEPLAIRKNLEQIKLDAAKRELALLKRRIQLSTQIVDALNTELMALSRASRQLHEASSDGKSSLDALYGNGPVMQAFAKTSGADATKLYDAVATYLDDQARLRPTVDKLKYQRLATYHQVSLVYAETNARQWMNLIAASVDQTAESASGGLKPDTINQAIQALALFWIAHGVN